MVLVFASYECKAQNEAKIKKIRTVFNQTNSYQKLIIKKLEGEEYMRHVTDGGGELTGYYKNNTLLKITDWVGISSGIIKDEYYFDNNKLIFVYETQQRFGFNDSLQTNDYSKLKTVFEGRYYIYNDSLIQKVVKGTPFSTSANQPDKKVSDTHLKKIYKYTELLNKKGHN